MLLPLGASAQELSEARYIGAMEGAAQACAAAYPAQARVYQDAVRRLVACHLNDEQFKSWQARLRASAEYSASVEQGQRSLDKHPANRERQCRSLQELVCGPGTKPSQP
ncbi:hypothetical protein G4G28_21190 [Massilia sp. Dwa41.01b]|uniref:hypothetical protein n=1 Tax=unclassified Massilia TaxID=2609279 RepID=UPI0016037BED|nr:MULTISPECIES: hypothetical protein [unclassified Massilia]QNA90385.1 hypothetical protein G4G28_21190 [Massilia sp. Dwa41.01b]QNA97611.1 hypothetical protein G4G31_00275 [Massilia sp. Se16.2.3]